MHDSSFFAQGGAADENVLMQCLEAMFTRQSSEPFHADKMAHYQTVNQVDLFASCGLPTSPSQDQEISLFMLGTFRDTFKLPQDFVFKCLQEFGNQDILVSMRILWLVEKQISLEHYFAPDQLSQIFTILLDTEVDGLSFPVRYQAIKTLTKCLKKINLKTEHPDKHAQVLTHMMKTAIVLLPECNEDTIHVPIQILTYLTRIDEQTTLALSSVELMQTLLQLYQKYQYDGLLEDDIVDLIKVQASIP